MCVWEDDDSETKPPFKPSEMSDEDVQWWVDEEHTLKDDFPHEENYVEGVEELNQALIERTVKRLTSKRK